MKKIAIIGMRGIPVIYGGFEVLAEELGVYLSEHSYNVIVYCRSNFINKKRKKFKKVNLITLPTLKSNSLETISHSLLSTIHAVFVTKPDVILYLGVGNTIYSAFPRLFGIKTVVHIDGQDWKREKWNSFGKSFLKISEKITPYLPNMAITDSVFMEKYYKKQYGKKIIDIPYGYMKNINGNSAILDKYGLQKNKFVVWVGRFVPENLLEEFINAYDKTNTNIKCVIIGDGVYKNNYIDHLYREISKNKNIIHTGFLGREDYSTIVKNSLAYIETKRSGGTHPSLVEAMGFGCFIISNPYMANKYILENTAIYYHSHERVDSLTTVLQNCFDGKFKTIALRLRKEAKKRAIENYDWEVIGGKFKTVFDTLLGTTTN